MKLNIVEVIIFLYQHYLDRNEERLPDLEKWLVQNTKQYLITTPPSKEKELEVTKQAKETRADPSASEAIRVYSQDERQRLDSMCQGYLLKLEQEGVISPPIREKIIQEALALDRELELLDIEYVAQDIICEEMENNAKLSHLHKIFVENQNLVLH